MNELDELLERARRLRKEDCNRGKHHWELINCDRETDTWRCMECGLIETAPCNFDEMMS